MGHRQRGLPGQEGAATVRFCSIGEDRRCAIADGTNTSVSRKQIRVLLVDDDPMVVRNIVRDFSAEGLAVTVARTAADAKAFLCRSFNRIDVVILAIHLPDGRGESLLPDIDACARQPAVIITSAFLPDLQPGALEYRPVAVPKPVCTAALLRTVRTVVDGYARPALQRFVKRFGLSRRETDAIVLLAQGLRAKEIAHHMSCSEKTVYAHLARVSRKTGCRDYHEVVCALLAFCCHVLGHTPPEHKAVVDSIPY